MVLKSLRFTTKKPAETLCSALWHNNTSWYPQTFSCFQCHRTAGLVWFPPPDSQKSHHWSLQSVVTALPSAPSSQHVAGALHATSAYASAFHRLIFFFASLLFDFCSLQKESCFQPCTELWIISGDFPAVGKLHYKWRISCRVVHVSQANCTIGSGLNVT